jgi:acetyl esterase/lipase
MPVDPVVAKLLADASSADPRGIDELTVEEARRRGGSAPVDAMVPFEDVAETRDVNASGVPARLYRPRGRTLPLLVYFHGGGWVVGSVEASDNYCRALANSSGCAVLSVEYRRAPEHRYPAAADDAFTTATYASEHAADLGVDRARIAVGGSSAGGNLAAVVAQRARAHGTPRIAAQLLHVPVTDNDFTRPSYRAYGTGHGLTESGMRWFWDHYLPDVGRRDEPDASPLRASDLSGLPPAIVVAAQCDPLLDEGRAYAERLRGAGVPVTYLEYAGMVHGFMSWSSKVPAARRAFDEFGAALRRALAD